MASKYITVIEGQSVWDICIQEYGDTSAMQDLLVDNPTVLNLQTTPVPGSKVLIDESKIKDKDIVNLFKETSNKPAYAVEVVEGPTAFTSGFSNGFK
jgi:hypothetical protein